MHTATASKQEKGFSRLKWWHCVMIYVVANGISFLPAGFNGNEAFYNNFLQPSVAPPDWAFAPVWFINNVTSLMALALIYNLPKSTAGRRSIITLEVISWVLYTVFTLLYFGLKSPILGAIDTVLGLGFTVASFVRCYFVSKRAFWLIAPRLAWLMLASYVSVWIALYNKDVLFKIGPFLMR